jgi:hypothetical protein
MCIGVSKAEPQTHTPLVVTLVLPSTGTGPLLVPTAIRTPTRAGSASGTTTTTPTSTVSLPTGDKSSSARTTTVRTIATSTLPPTATTSPETSDGQRRFSSAEIAGIALGCAAVLIFGVLLVVLARCIRRRRFGDLEAGFSRMRDSLSFGRKSRRDSDPGGLQISSPLPRVHVSRDPLDPRWQPQVPQMKQVKQVSQANQVKQVGLGLPISPYASRGGTFVKPSPALASVLSAPLPPTPAPNLVPAPVPTPAAPPRGVPKVVLSPAPEPKAPSAEQSPPKPALTLAIPKEQQRVPRIPPPNARDSVVTEFAEDGEEDIAPGTAIWRPPATDPQSATTVYFADKGGNWILRNPSARRPEAGSSRRVSGPTQPVIQEVAAAPVEVELPSPDHKTRAERAKDAYGGFSPDAVVSPLRLPRKPGQGRLGSPIAFKDQRREPQLSSPSLSARMSQSAQTIQSELEQTKDRQPEIYFTMMRESRDLTGGRSKRRSTRRANRPVSQASATSIESGADDEDIIIEDEPQVDLSPVAESPHTPISPGKSRVKYPEIRKQQGGQQVARPNKAPESDLLPPGHKYNVWHPPGRSSPTGSSSFPGTRNPVPAVPRSNGPDRRWNAPDLKPRNPGQPRTGSPEARAGPASPGQSWQRQRQVANPASYWNQQQSPPPTRVRPPPPPTPPYELPGENTPPRRYDTPPQQQQQQQQRRPMRPTDPRQLPTPASTPQRQPQPKPQQQAQRQQPQPRPTAASDTPNQIQGSLLAKRRGADRVPAALTLANGGNQKRGGAGAAGGGKGKAGWTREVEYGPVPITPGWVPELTPTRRGDDLYLNVR